MPRLRNSVTGVVVNVSDETAATLGPEWKPLDKSEPQKKPAPKRATKK